MPRWPAPSCTRWTAATTPRSSRWSGPSKTSTSRSAPRAARRRHSWPRYLASGTPPWTPGTAARTSAPPASPYPPRTTPVSAASEYARAVPHLTSQASRNTHVLPRPAPPMAGAVRIGGTDPRALRHENLVAGVTFVEQDSQLLSGTVADNLRLARPDATADELRAAMKVAVLAGHVDPASQLGPGGEGLSGGQRRRLGVAQAYLRHPGLLLLDEPTEGLDHHTARALLENLRSALPGTTIIAAIHDRTLDHLPVPADATVRLAAGSVLADLAPQRSAGPLGQLVVEWKLRCDVRPGPGRAVDADRAAQSLHAVGEAGQARTKRGIGPANSVVA